MNRMTAVASTAALALTLVSGAALAQDFRALAQQDLQAAHDALAANHPAAVVPGAPGDAFRNWINTGLQDAQAKSARVNSGDSHAYLMRYYASGFRDSSVTIQPTFEGLGPFYAIGWPGFSTAWRNGEYVVSYVKDGVRGAPPVGAVLVSCGDQSAADLAQSRLDKWEGDLTSEADRVRTAPYLLWNRNNPFTVGVSTAQCKFKQGRRDRDYTLSNQPVDAASLEAAYRAGAYVPGPVPLSVETVNGRPWISVHSLADNAGWDAFLAAVEGQLTAIHGPQGFVLDLRGAGGSSANAVARGYSLANRIWTPDFTVSRQPPAGSVTYRASTENRQWYADLLGRMKADPRFVQESGAVVEQTESIVAAFDSALAAGQQSFTLPGRPSTPNDGTANPVAGPVIVLVDGGCVSGCLDVLDLLTRLPNVRLAGTVTGQASIFVEPTVQRLPSNYADLSYGHKAWVTRTRGNNAPFTPEAGLAYTGAPSDEAAVRTWVGTLF